MTKTSKPSSNKFICKFCNKGFSRENTLVVHMCEPKRRWQSKDDTGPRIGLTAFKRFYDQTQPQTKHEKTHEDFIKSQYYIAFVKFGWFVHQVRAVNPMGYVDFLLKNNVKLDWWTKDRFYEKYIIEHMKKESPGDGIARTIHELDRWAEENNTTLDKFFKEASTNKIINLISNGRLSPWFLFNCDQGVNMLDNLNEEQLTIAFKWIDPVSWQNKFEKYPEEVTWIKELLAEEGFND